MDKPIKATFLGIDEDSKSELMDEFDLSEEDINKINSYKGKSCTLTIACFVDEDDFESNYYDAEFEDGFVMDFALSGIYFKE